jgi:hypothetical protein
MNYVFTNDQKAVLRNNFSFTVENGNLIRDFIK